MKGSAHQPLIDYLKDIRSMSVYKQNCIAGFQNQANCLAKFYEEFGIDYIQCQIEKFIEDVKNDLKPYLPDSFILVKKRWELVEVKATMALITDIIDLKKGQVDRCQKRCAAIIYANREWFGYVRASRIPPVNPIISTRLTSKECYPVSRKIFNWHRWNTPFIVVPYQKGNIAP